MTTTECLLCLELNKDLDECIKINSSQWKDQCIDGVIEKHLWPMANLKSHSSWLCLLCWTYLNDFHQFYTRIENANLYYECFVKSEVDTSIQNLKALPENLIIPETALTEDVPLDRDTDGTYENNEYLLETEKKIISEDESLTESEVIRSKKYEDNKIVRNPLEVFTLKESKTIKTNQSKSGSDDDYQQQQDIENVAQVPLYGSDNSTAADYGNINSPISETHFDYTDATNREDSDDFLAQHYTFSCIICQKSCKSFTMLQEHFKAEHKMEAYVTCCGKKIKSRQSLVDHGHTHFTMQNDFRNKSKVIKPEDDSDDIISQLYNDHDDGNRTEVIEETHDFITEKDTQQTAAENYDSFIAKHFQIKCGICQYATMTFAKLRLHFAKRHKHQPTFVFCCGRKIKRPRCLFEHIHTHLNPQYFKCKYCPRVLKDRRNLHHHMLRHEGKLESTKRSKKTENVTSKNMKTIDKVSFTTPVVVEEELEKDSKQGQDTFLVKSEGIDMQDDSNSDNLLPKKCTPDSGNGNSTKDSLEVGDKYATVTDEEEEDEDEFLAKHIQLKCPKCQETCTNFLKLRHHFIARHNSQKPYFLCCERKHTARRCLVDHIKTHLNPDYFKCKYCARVLKERRHFLHHVATHEGTAFRCNVCDKKFDSKFEFEVHKKTHSQKEFSCSKCGESYDRRYQLYRHIKAVHRGKTLSSDKVPENMQLIEDTEKNDFSLTSTIVKSELVIEADVAPEEDSLDNESNEDPENSSHHKSDLSDAEMLSEKNNDPESDDMEHNLPAHTIKPGDYDEFLAKHVKFTCSICQESCQNFKLLRQHFAEVHKRGGYVLCCGTKHKTRSFLVDHIHTHLNPNYFQCQQCQKVLKERRGLLNHIAWHKGKVYRCNICTRKFFDKTKYRAHRSTHKSNKKEQFSCPECGKGFGNKALLSFHQKSIHMNMYVKLCDICGITFRGSVCFRNHMEKHKGVVVSTFPCDICGRLLSGKKTLKLHKMAVHPEGGARPYACHICSKTEVTRSRLTAHIRKSHNTSYDHKCTICERAFKQSKSLKAHMVIHTGGEPLFTCDWCTKTFNSSGNLSSHRQRVHPMEYKEWKSKYYLGDLPHKFKSKSSIL